MRVENPDARSFYEIECTQQQWSKRQLSRQVGSCLYERLALSRNKDEVMRLAKEGQTYSPRPWTDASVWQLLRPLCEAKL